MDRLRLCRYTSPSGTTYEAQFDELSRDGGKKGGVLELPQQDRAVVQDLGAKATVFALKLYFSGADYDQTADSFFSALAEHGPGLLSHPRWGDVSVLALSYGQSEDFVEGLGRAVFDISFVLDPGTVATASTATSATVSATARRSRAKAQASLAAKFGSPALRDLAECKERVRKTLHDTRRKLLTLTGSISETAQKINSEILSTLGDLDALILAPASLAEALGSILSIPADTSLSVSAKLASFRDLLIATIYGVPETSAQAALAIFTAQAIASSAAESSASGSISSRAEAIAAHDALVALSREAREAIERAEAGGSTSADPETMQALTLAAAQAAAYLLESSFSLRVERRITLDGASHPHELAWRFYRDLNRVDELIAQNHLGGDVLLVIPAGTEIRYYAE